MDLNLESFGEVVRERFPHLVAHHGRVAQLPGAWGIVCVVPWMGWMCVGNRLAVEFRGPAARCVGYCVCRVMGGLWCGTKCAWVTVQQLRGPVARQLSGA